jgi:predicted phage-related endonuclease
MQTVNLIQGSPEWQAHRANYFNASDAPAMMGCSKYKTRDELMSQIKTGLSKEVDNATQKRFDAEKITGEDLSPIVGVDGKYSASFDGINFDRTVIFEHKTLNDELREAEDDAYYLPLMYRVQMEQQLMISGAEKCLFMASKWSQDAISGEFSLHEEKHWWYAPDLKLRKAIVAGWDRLEKDLETFVPTAIKEKINAEIVQSLPVPSVTVKGELVGCNVDQVKEVIETYLSNINTELKTDQDFANAESNAKNCREGAKALKQSAKAVVAQMQSINDVVSTIEQLAAKCDAMGLQLEKMVTTQKENVKQAAIMKAKTDYADHVSELQKGLEVTLHIHLAAPDFASAIKGVKTLESMHSRINDALAYGKTEATVLANDVKTKLAFIDNAGKGYEHLINKQTLAFKDIDFIKLSIQATIDQENARLAEHEARIKLKAEADAKEKLERKEQATSTILPPALEQEFGKQFVDGLDDIPTANDIINTIANAYKVNPTTAQQYIINTYEFIRKAA